MDSANEKHRLEKTTIEIPTLFIQAAKDAALPPALSVGMEKYFSYLTKRNVQTSHWALWEAPEQLNDMIKHWLEATAFAGGKSSL